MHRKVVELDVAIAKHCDMIMITLIIWEDSDVAVERIAFQQL